MATTKQRAGRSVAVRVLSFLVVASAPFTPGCACLQALTGGAARAAQGVTGAILPQAPAVASAATLGTASGPTPVMAAPVATEATTEGGSDPVGRASERAELRMPEADQATD